MPENVHDDDKAAKATIDLLLEEYRALRDSVNARSAMRGQLLGFTTAGLAAAIALHAQGWVVVAAFVGLSVVGLIVLGNTNAVHKALMRQLARIEGRINTLAAASGGHHDPVLTWHTEWIALHGIEQPRGWRDYLP